MDVQIALRLVVNFVLVLIMIIAWDLVFAFWYSRSRIFIDSLPGMVSMLAASLTGALAATWVDYWKWPSRLKAIVENRAREKIAK